MPMGAIRAPLMKAALTPAPYHHGVMPRRPRLK